MGNILNLSLVYISLGKKLVWHSRSGQIPFSTKATLPTWHAVFFGAGGQESQDEYRRSVSPFLTPSFGFNSTSRTVTAQADLIPSPRAGFGASLRAPRCPERPIERGAGSAEPGEPSVELLHPLQPAARTSRGQSWGGGRKKKKKKK